MSTNFPVTLDTYAALVDNTDDVLAAHPNDRGDAIEALEAKVGVDSSAVTTSHDYKIDALETAVRPVPLGGTGAATLTDHGILLGSGAGAVTPTAVMSNGQLLVGQTGADPLPKTISGDITVTAAGATAIGNDKVSTQHYASASVDQTAIGANAVGQSELKTTSAEANTGSIVNGEAGAVALPGGIYGLLGITVKQSAASTTHFQGFGYTNLLSAYVTPRASFLNQSGGNRTFYITQYYVQASGEIFWYMMMRDKTTKESRGAIASPDHPCFFATSNNPEDTPHPWVGEYDPELHEILVVALSKPELKEIDDFIETRYEADGTVLSRMEVIEARYELDESIEVDYPKEKITIGLPPHWHSAWLGKEKVKPLKKEITKPNYIKCVKMKEKQNESG